MKPLDLSECVRESAELLGSAVSEQIELSFHLTAQLPAVEADPGQVQQIVMNLVLNAVEACGSLPGTVAVSTGVVKLDEVESDAFTPASPAPGLYVGIRVEDDGAGMDDETRARIFDPFFTTRETGKGLGLAAALGIVRSHGGAIRVDSEPGRGSTVLALLPASTKPVHESAPDRPGNLAGRGRILVVDDNRMILDAASRALEHFGYDVITASGGREALDVLEERAGEISLVLLDMAMPEMDGENALLEIRRLAPATPVLLMSGYHDLEATRRLVGVGAARFVAKPFTLAGLGQMVQEALGGEARGPAGG